MSSMEYEPRGEAEAFRKEPEVKQPRIKASKDEWTQIRFQKAGPCRVCGQTSMRDSGLHHLVARSLGGDDISENCVPLCGSGTTRCHGLIEAHDPWACSQLRKNMTAEEISYVGRKKGYDYLERRYPIVNTDIDTMKPGAPCPTCHRKVPEAFRGEKERKRITFSLKVPKDEQENGHEVLSSLVEQAAEKLGKPGQPPYYTLIPVLYEFVTGTGDE